MKLPRPFFFLRTPNSQRIRRTLPALILVASTLLLSSAGCSESEPQPAESEKDSSGGITEAEKCRDKLAAGIRRLNPSTFALQANPERSVNGLNAWLANCGADEIKELRLDDAAIQRIGDSARATALRFTPNDGTYIRDCLLLRDLTTAISEKAVSEAAAEQQETAIVHSIFEWIVRNLSLTADGVERPPLGLTDTLMTGVGSVNDRAWVFAEALRQQQMDGFIIRSSAAPAESGTTLDTADFLIGVALENRTFVFDALTGLPVAPAESNDPLSVTAEPIDVLKQHDRWKESTVELIAQLNTFAPRMFYLQQELAVEDSAVLFEELTGGVSEIRPLIERVTGAGDGLWDANEIFVWSYPEERTLAAQSLTEEQRKDFTDLMRPFQAPFERTTFATESTEEMTTVPEELTPEERRALIEQRLAEEFTRRIQSSEELFGKPSQRLLKTRIQQLLGDRDSGVIQQLQQIRIMSMEQSVRVQVPTMLQQMNPGMPGILEIPFPQKIREVNESSTGSALYWTALRQIERDDPAAAVTTLKNYRRQYAGSQWKFPSMINQAFALLQLDRADDAVEVLQEADTEENPERLRVQTLIGMLQAE